MFWKIGFGDKWKIQTNFAIAFTFTKDTDEEKDMNFKSGDVSVKTGDDTNELEWILMNLKLLSFYSSWKSE